MNSPKYKIFISHRSEDRAIASAVSGALRLLGDNKLEPFVCTDIPGGREWRDWIDDKINLSDIMLFLYTEEAIDWMWCFYEIGLFRHPNDPNPRPIICIQNPAIKNLPSPLEKYQAYQATEDGIKRFLEDLLYKGEFTNKDRINEKLFANDNYLLAIKDFLKAFKPSTMEKKFYTRRVQFDLKNIDQKENETGDHQILISGDSYTMDEILLSPGKYTHWQSLYDKFKTAGQSNWLDQIIESIENIKREKNPIFVMRPFESKEKKFIPILTRVEQMPSEDNTSIIPLSIYAIFIPCSDLLKNCGLIDLRFASDPKYLMEMWQTILPTSIIRVKWKKKSSPIGYSVEDIEGEPVVYAINPSFADLYTFNYGAFPDPDGNSPLTSGELLKHVEKFIDGGEAYISKIMEDQGKISQKILFEESNAFATVPLKLNDKHPVYPNTSWLPCLVSKNTSGDINGPHIAYLGVIYVRGDWAS